VSSSTAELTLILKAKNLAETEFAKVKEGMQTIATKASVVAADMAAAFKGVGRRIAGAMGNLATDILSGGNIVNHLLNVGAIMAGAAVEGLMAHFIPNLLARLAATETFAPVAAALTAEGGGLGGILAAAIAVGTAALPFLLLAAAVGALVYLLNNPEARQKAHDIGVAIVKWIVDGLAGLASAFAQKITEAIPGMQGVGSSGNSVEDILRRQAQQNSHAAGGWVGLNGPEIALVGEKGPEFINPAGTGTGDGGGGVRIVGVSEDQLFDMIDRRFYFKLQRAAPTQVKA
jgi:hypothetical protein